MIIIIVGTLLAIDVSKDGNMIATVGDDCLIHVWKTSCDT